MLSRATSTQGLLSYLGCDAQEAQSGGQERYTVGALRQAVPKGFEVWCATLSQAFLEPGINTVSLWKQEEA